jgi:hypothetical protein
MSFLGKITNEKTEKTTYSYEVYLLSAQPQERRTTISIEISKFEEFKSYVSANDIVSLNLDEH